MSARYSVLRSAVFRSAALVLGAAAVAGAAAACRSTPAPAAVAADTWAVVDGHEIKRDDVDKAFRRSRDASSAASEEETLLAKLNLLDQMILQQVLLSKAAALKIEVPQGELDTA
jgi:hypothetical protein